MDVARKQVRDILCGNQILKIILERVQVVAPGPKPSKSENTLSPRKIRVKSKDRSLRNASEPGSGSCPGSSNRPQRNKKQNYVHFFAGGNSSEEDDGNKSDASGSNSEPNEASDCEFQSPSSNKAKWKAKSSNKTSTHVVTSLQCDLCSQKYKKPFALENHIIRVHVVDKPFKCDICCNYFLTKQRLRQHSLRIHNPEISPFVDKSFKCGVCCKSFLTELGLRQHNWQIHKRKNNSRLRLRKENQRIHRHKNPPKKVNKTNSISWLQCDLCPYKCTTQQWLEHHILQAHVVDKPFECGICFKSFMTNKMLTKHKETHADKNVNCTLCPTESFKDSASLAKHFEKIHKSHNKCDSAATSDNLLCPVCDTWFLTDADLAQHLKKPESESVMKCDICSELVHTPCRLNQHRQYMHNEIPVADASRRQTKVKNIVESPRKKHSEKLTENSASVKNQASSNKFSCIVCSALFSRRSDLDLHQLQEKHSCWKCPICAKLLSWQGDLKRHIQSVHSDARPFKCTYKGCSKSYKLLQVLKKHMDMHDPDSYYIKCDVCSKKFGTRKTMKAHLLTHTDERPFPCKFCDLKYKSVSTANGHMKKCEFRTADQRKKFAKWSSTIVRSAKTRKPGKIFISGKWTKLTDQAVKLDETAEATPVCTSELNCASTGENGTEISSSLKLIKQEADFKLTKQDVDLNYFSDNSSDFDHSPEPAVSVAKLEIIPKQEMYTYSD